MTNIRQIYEYLMRTMDNLLLLIIGIALFAFLWGVLRYIRSYDNEKERSASVSYMTYGIISLLVIVSMWGFVYLLGDTIGVKLKLQRGSWTIDSTDRDFTTDIEKPIEDVPELNIKDALDPDPEKFFDSLKN